MNTPTNPTPAPGPTPRTDYIEHRQFGAADTTRHDFQIALELARTLETELAQAKAEIVRLQEFELDVTCIGRDLRDYCKDLKADRSRRLPTLVVTMIGNLRDRAEKAESDLAATKAALAEAVKDKERLEQDVVRAAAWAANTDLALGSLKSKVRAFAAGIINTEWKTNAPRVIGFRAEYAAMVDEAHKPSPGLPDAARDRKEGV